MGFIHKINSVSVLQAFLFMCSCFFLEFNTALDTIRFNQSVRASESLVSNDQTFKLGFFSPVNSSYLYLGIMYNTQDMAVIWVANREKPLTDTDGTLLISEDGNLVVLNGHKEMVWSSNVSNLVANSSAQLLDTGNLVLQDNSNGRIIWESFQHASDSFVEGMEIFNELNTGKENKMTSWKSSSDPAVGSFSSTIEPLEIPQSFVWNNSYPYWRSGPWDGQVFIGIPGMKSYYRHGLDLVNDNPGTAYLSFTNLNSLVVYYNLNPSGILEEKVRYDNKGDWKAVWISIQSECDIYGKCGPFGSCNAQEKPICSCLPGYEPKNTKQWSATNWTGGCTRKLPLQCQKTDSASGMGKEDGFLRLKTVKLPDRLKWLPSMEPDCGNQCLNNCSCIAYAYHSGIGCMHWTENLIDIQKFSSGGADLYIRLEHSEISNKKDHKAIIATAVVLLLIGILLCAYFLWKLSVKFRGSEQEQVLLRSRDVEMDPQCSKESTLKDEAYAVKLPLFEFVMLSHATDNFNSINKLGQGGFGAVFKGKLPNGQEIAVKRLASSSNQGQEEFMNEVEVISKLQHRNLVRILGCCVECEEKMLVYEFMPNRSLDGYIFGSNKQAILDWQQRVIIIEGICRGLLYLHRDSRLRIIHRDLKPSNILLDKELNPKISDFGMARIFGGKEDQAKTTTRVVGTYGYMAPEYAFQGRFSEKSDVFSFGVLLLEIVSGRRNSSFHHEDQALSLIGYAWKLWNEEKIINLMDKVIYDPQMEKEMERYAHVGILCVQEMAKERPNISTVLSMLTSDIAELPRPKQPGFPINQWSQETETSEKIPSKCSFANSTITIIEGR